MSGEDKVFIGIGGIIMLCVVVMIGAEFVSGPATQKNSCRCVCEADQDSKPESGRYK